MTTTDRIKSHVLRRLQRQALRTAFAQACAAGLLHQESVTVQGVNVRRYKQGARAERLVGPMAYDDATVRRLLARPRLSGPTIPTIESLNEEAIEELLWEANGVQPEDLPNNRSHTAPESSKGLSADDARGPVPQQLLQTLCRVKTSLPAAEVAVGLLLASACRAPGLSPEKVMAILASPSPMICIKASIQDFDAVLTSMLNGGTLLPRAVHLQDGLSAYPRDLPGNGDGSSDVTTVLTFKLSHLESVGRERARTAVAKARRYAAPTLIMTELGIHLPGRISGGADLVLDTPMLDARLLADVIAICCGFPIEQVIAGIQGQAISILHLGLDDLTLAIRAGRTLPDILTRLEVLSQENRSLEGDGDDEDVSEDSAFSGKKKQKSGTSTSSSTRSHSAERSRSDKSGKHSIDIIQPQPTNRRARQMQSNLLVESLTGYGDARQWALDLKADLKLWGKKKLRWSDMSTKLLLSGPPGTGKTTFARALCNSLQIPLIATSVAEWLEPGYLGDVLRRMTIVFEAAQAQQPVIMLIDEIDGIGRRDAGAARYYDDYWVSVINRLLELLDGALKSEGIIVIGATNRPDVIDPALRRSGRLEAHVPIQPPDLDALEGIFAHHLGPDLKRIIANSVQAKALPAYLQEPAHG